MITGTRVASHSHGQAWCVSAIQDLLVEGQCSGLDPGPVCARADMSSQTRVVDSLAERNAWGMRVKCALTCFAGDL